MGAPALATETPSDSTGLPIRPVPDGSDVRKVAPSDFPDVIDGVVRAFYDDPLFSWMFPRPERRAKQTEEAFRLFARRIWLPQGESYTTDRLIGACFWMPPGTAQLGVLSQLLLLPGMARACRRDLTRVMRVLAAMDREHPHDPHYYLPVIGIGPEWQGRGFGAALLRPMLDRCDREGLPAYLEASSPRNRALYERHGFEAVGQFTVADSPPLWPMWRAPAGAS